MGVFAQWIRRAGLRKLGGAKLRVGGLRLTQGQQPDFIDPILLTRFY